MRDNERGRSRSVALSTPVEQWKMACSDRSLRYGMRLMSLGSCFSDNIAQRLHGLGFDILVNPYGTLYNPLSIARALEELLDAERHYTCEQLIRANGVWVSPMHHSSFSDTDEAALVAHLNETLDRSRLYATEADWLLLTLGSSYCYWWKASGEMVANCHRLPAELFEHRMASVAEMELRLTSALDRLLERNRSLCVLLTISPIRYLAYGAEGNAESKARLVLLKEALKARYGARLSYFPSYEIMLDELRDYRFYAEDMVHPSEMAVRILFERLMDGWLDASATEALGTAEALQRLVQHRPKDEAAHRAQIERAASLLATRFPEVQTEQILRS